MSKVITFMNWYVEISRFEGCSSKTRKQGLPVMLSRPERVQGKLDLALSGFARSELARSSLSELISAEKCNFVE
jgi:hypothetical protein